MNESHEEFVSDPIATGKAITFLMLAILALIAAVIYFVGDPLAKSKFAQNGLKSAESVVVFLTVIVAIVVGLTWFLILAFQPHITTRIFEDRISIDSEPYLFGEPRSIILTLAEIEFVKHMFPKRKHESLRAVVRGREIELMSKNFSNHRQFERLLAILGSKTTVV